MKGKTRHDGCEGHCVLISSAECSATYVVETGVIEILYDRAQEGDEEQGSQELYCHGCPKDCTHHQLARSKDPCEGGQVGKEKGS